jgi:hypothetical protein
VRDFLTAQIERLGDQLWDAAERETKEGVACLTGAGECPSGAPGRMTLVPTGPEDRKLIRQSFQDVVSPNWSERCGAECVANWNSTIGRVLDLTVAANR